MYLDEEYKYSQYGYHNNSSLVDENMTIYDVLRIDTKLLYGLDCSNKSETLRCTRCTMNLVQRSESGNVIYMRVYVA